MSGSSQYQNSQAFNQSFSTAESVNPNTGSFTFSKSLVSLRGITSSIGLNINLSYASGTTGLMGLPSGWSFGIAFVVPGSSLTTQGQTSIIDLTWSDETGYQSGLRYLNDHGIKFSPVVPDQPLPSGQPGTYAYKLSYGDGGCDYYDATGKLVEHADLFGNHINYFYTDQFSGALNNQLDYITDSFGQVVRFGYGSNAIIITTPDGGQNTINFSSRGVENIVDPLGNATVLNYTTCANQTVVSTIQYPTGLNTTMTYTGIAYVDANGAESAFPAVSMLTHLDSDASIADCTTYAFGTDSDGNTFTGYAAGYRMSAGTDSLMDSNNTLYIYDVLTSKCDASGALLSASRVYYNYLHAPVREEHYLVDASHEVQCGYRALYSYLINPDLHARSVNYNRPVTTEQFVYSAAVNDYLRIRKSTSSYDDYGQMLSSEELCYDRTAQAYKSQVAASFTYTVASWGGEMPATEIYIDNVTGFQRQVAYTLSADQKSLASAAVLFRTNAQDSWAPWKTTCYGYDPQGRLISTALAWSQDASYSEGSVASTSSTCAYAYDPSAYLLTVSLTNAIGAVTKTTYDVTKPAGPAVLMTTPLGESQTFEFDLLGRVSKQTDALGLTTLTTYKLFATDQANSVLSSAPNGYLTELFFDALGRPVKLMDNGDPSMAGGSPNRCLRQKCYGPLGNPSQDIDELGLVTRYQYDSLNRLVQSTDPLGNVGTTVFDDAQLSVSAYTNDILRDVTQLDGLGRTQTLTSYPDPDDSASAYAKLNESEYSGLGQILRTVISQLPKQGGNPQALYENSYSYDVEAKVITEVCSGYSGPQLTTTRNTFYDLFGNPLGYAKQTDYADGRSFQNDACIPRYNAANLLVSVTNQLGQVESYSYDDDGRMLTRTRFDGTVISYSYDKVGKLLQTAWNGGSIDCSYYPNDRIKSVTLGGAAILYDYYLDGSAKSITYPDGRSQSYSVDTFSRITSQTDASGMVTSNLFDTYGRIAKRTNGIDTITNVYGTINHTAGVLQGVELTGSGQFTWQYAYNGFGELSATAIANAAGASVLNTRYTRDTASRLIETAVSSATCNDFAVNYSRSCLYDGLNQLVGATTTYSNGKPAVQIAFAYDGNGNPLSKTTNGVVSDYTYNAIDQLVGAGIVYDQNGRMTSDGSGRQYAYNALDQLIQISGSAPAPADYDYYPDGALASNSNTASGSKLQYYYNGAVNAILSQSTAEDWTSFLFSGPDRLAAYEGQQASSYYMTAAGSTALLQDANGESAIFSYDPYGAVTSQGDISAKQSFTWNQEYADPSNGLVYLRARYYHPGLMRFMTMDSVLNDNRYAYCSGDPINLIDPTGHSEAANIAGAVVGGIVGSVATVFTGFFGGMAAAMVFGPESLLASTGVTALAGATGSITANGYRAAISGQKLSGGRALMDLASGALGGAVGAGVGGYAGRVAMRNALSQGLSQSAITRIGAVCSAGIGGLAGAATSAGVTSLATGQPFFSKTTALSMTVGFFGGAGGGLLTSGAYLGLLSNKIIPVPLTESELDLITPARDQRGAMLSKRLLVMAPQPEANATADQFFARYGNYDAALTLDYQPGSQTYDTIAAHGAGNTMFASVEYKPGGILTREPNMVRPITGKLFARYASDAWRGRDATEAIKVMSCHSAFSNAQSIADAFGSETFGGYPEINRFTFTDWQVRQPRRQG
ncbi:RHS repeat domain-containing protein [Chitinimonas sp. JJ19]|uniref:RHS repeat domain-containing protein n=1 Tax=Chitinimonas sp. JJ19 TaxID=3109352 RepID=UPI003003272F